MDDSADLTVRKRAVRVALRLFRGERLTAGQVRELCGYADESTAYDLLNDISGLYELPLTDVDGVWFLVRAD